MEVAVIGPGTIGLMVAQRFVSAGVCEAENLRLCRVEPERLTMVKRVLPQARILTENAEAVEDAEIVVLAIKPKFIEVVTAELKDRIRDDALVISVVTGLNLGTMQKQLGVRNVVRTSPNIGIGVGAATTYWIAGPDVRPEARELAAKIVSIWGDEIECGEESYLDIAMVGVGSGPALVLEFVQALTRAMVTQGMPRDLAERGILSLLRGTVELRNAASDRALSEFQQEVITPGGITAEALLAMEEGKFRATVINAFRRAHEKVSRLAPVEKAN
jgi:pyrroline-5-carboxylate reductase